MPNGPPSKRNITFIFKDSYRVFPVSLKELSTVFSPEDKFIKQDTYNNIFNDAKFIIENVLTEGTQDLKVKNEFLNYIKLDTEALHHSIRIAQEIYLKAYKIDINTTYSTSSLAFKIFKEKFLHSEIQKLTCEKVNGF